MRKIKFRAWDAQSNEWMYAGLKNGVPSFPLTVSTPLHLGLDSRVDAYENTVWGLNDDELIWCQFTGLIDKNGVEIYEGDIVKKSKYNYTELKQTYGVVTYNTRLCAFLWEGCGCSSILKEDEIFTYTEPIIGHDRDNVPHTVEVIGNIYEHPHLLHVKDEA